VTDRILRETEVARVTGLARTTRYELEKEGLFPRRRHITKAAVGWLESEVQRWLRSREKCSRADVADQADPRASQPHSSEVLA
jgi:prophage regulatory protein